MAPRYDWSATPEVVGYIFPPDPPIPCPFCGYAKATIVRTEQEGKVRKCVCYRCSKRFRVRLQLCQTWQFDTQAHFPNNQATP